MHGDHKKENAKKRKHKMYGNYSGQQICGHHYTSKPGIQQQGNEPQGCVGEYGFKIPE
jgi:hypothetical protein